MTFSGHVAVTGVTLCYIKDPKLILLANLVAHPLLDAIPHAEWATFQETKWLMIAITVFDILVACGYIQQLFVHTQQPTFLILAALVAGMWMDILDPVFRVWCPPLRLLHLYTHTWPHPPVEHIEWSKTVTGTTPLWIKLVIQNLLVVGCYWLLRRG